MHSAAESEILGVRGYLKVEIHVRSLDGGNRADVRSVTAIILQPTRIQPRLMLRGLFTTAAITMLQRMFCRISLA